MATNPTVSELRKAAEVTDQEIDAASDAVLTDLATEAYPLAKGWTLDLVEIIRRNAVVAGALKSEGRLEAQHDPDRDPAGTSGEGMSDDTPEARAEWKVRLVAFLLPHLKGSEAERHSAINAVLMALDTAHAEGIRHAARFCRTVGTGAQQHGEAATALAEVMEAMAARVDDDAVDAARQWQDEP